MMSALLNERLFDVMLRKQFYIEAVKANEAREFNSVLKELDEEISKVLSRIKYQHLGMLTKIELFGLIRALRKSQNVIYTRYTQDLLNKLSLFMQADFSLTKQLAAALISEESYLTPQDSHSVIMDEFETNNQPLIYRFNPIEDEERFWGVVNNAPIPASGLLLGAFVAGFGKSAQASVESLIIKGYANNSTPAEVISQITAKKAKQGSQSQLVKISNQNKTVVSTALQHVSSMVIAAVMSLVFPKYRWDSVIDSATTDICYSRNKKIYKYGEGPLPPAHNGCRSHTTPVADDSAFAVPSLGSWYKKQPEAFKIDVFGTAEMPNSFSQDSFNSISVSSYENKARNILT